MRSALLVLLGFARQDPQFVLWWLVARRGQPADRGAGTESVRLPRRQERAQRRLPGGRWSPTGPVLLAVS